ncbi:hypothetical protein N7E73_12675 [Maridesulfovibrio sp. FT414]
MVKETPTRDEFLAWQKIAGVDKKKFVNTNGRKYQETGLKDTIDAMSDADLFELISSDGMLVKRPILVADSFVLIGFRQADWEARLL